METLYINNLNDKVSLNKLISSLQELFKEYGNIIQITAHSNLKMKGQAFITFDSPEASTRAQKELDSFQLHSKKIRVSFARTNSDNFFKVVKADEKPVAARKAAKEEQNRKRKHTTKNTTKPTKKRKVDEFERLPPHKVLLLQNIAPSSTESHILNGYFEKFDGLVNVRLVKVRSLAFVEFESEPLATACLENTDKSALSAFGDNAILTYAKK